MSSKDLYPLRNVVNSPIYPVAIGAESQAKIPMKRMLAEDLTGEGESHRMKLMCLRQESSKCLRKSDRFASGQIPEASPRRRREPIPPRLNKAHQVMFAHDQFPSVANRHPTTPRVLARSEGCLLCGLTSTNKGVLKRHIIDQHYPQFQYTCVEPGCGLNKHRKDKIRNHIRSHPALDPESFVRTEFAAPPQCTICSKVSNSWDAFYTCLLSHHETASQPEQAAFERSTAKYGRGSKDSSLFKAVSGL
ncbi:hypothetical protein N7481_000565 [Penicillium waksmanii]|uniref:uncharacterized protein n=1 Tax=Penicillium waksmanii TaxID=69791 RepID=UPI002547F73D|nr:uncharacterized protein N7481_000565 [Penicillium waksmanii]KAJ6000156.1 hypothetical protein N7481_000565 [Penicillium waksmanii]